MPAQKNAGNMDFDATREAENQQYLRATAHTTPEERKLAFGILFFCQLAVGMGQTLVFAVVPPIARHFGMSDFETTMIYSLSSLLWVLTSPFWGKRSDRMGRKPIILVGLLAYAISTLLFAIIVLLGLWEWLPVWIIFPLLLVARSIFGGLGSGNPPASQAYIADRTTRAERAQGVASLGAAFGLGTALGPGIAAAFSEIHILAPFFAVALLAFASAGLIWFYLPERSAPTAQVLERSESRSSLKMTDPKALPWVIIGVIVSFAQSIVMQLCAFYFMDVLKLKGDAATQMVSVALMAMAMAALFAQIGLIQRFNLSVKFLMRWGSIIMLFSFAGLIVGGSYGLLVAALTLAGIGFGLLRPGLQAGASLSVSPKDQGAIAGLITSTAATGQILNPFIGIPLYHYWHQAPFMVGAFLIVIILVFIRFHPAMKNLDEERNVTNHNMQDEDLGIH